MVYAILHVAAIKSTYPMDRLVGSPEALALWSSRAVEDSASATAFYIQRAHMYR